MQISLPVLKAWKCGCSTSRISHGTHWRSARCVSRCNTTLPTAAKARSGSAPSRSRGAAARPPRRDPLEPLNRGIYRFNDIIDKAVIKPVAQGYNAVMPLPGKIMVRNFIFNMDDVLVTANDLLQFKFSQAAADGARVLFNTTFGVFGLFNVTQRMEEDNEDFGP